VTPALPIAELVVAVRQGDAEARARLVDAWLPVVLRWCTCLAGPTVEPEDAAHDVLLLALTRIDQLRVAEAFPAWIFGMTRRVLADRRRAAWVRRWLPWPLVEPADPADGPARRHERDEVAARVQGILDQLAAPHREVLVLCDVEERTGEEAAVLLGVPLGTVKSRLRVARARFETLARTAGLGHASGPDET
jgi:RNA polymerase sigma-70 factor (ECF subfamily)